MFSGLIFAVYCCRYYIFFKSVCYHRL